MATSRRWVRGISLVAMVAGGMAACVGQSVRQDDDSSACEIARDCVLVPAACCNDNHCAPCDAPRPNPWLFAACHAGRCVAVDARGTELTACSDPSDCELRTGLECCEACRVIPENIVAINSSVDLVAWLCGTESAFCDACAPTLPRQFFATCENQRCVVQAVSPPP
jgi:hypothetical protein